MSGLSDYLSEIIRITKELEEKHYKVIDSKPLIAFRGESQDYGKTKLMPSLFRNSDYLQKEKHLFDLISDYELLSDKNITTNIDKAIGAQHYVSISRMLDITFNAAISLYFSCESSKNEDGYVYIFCFPKYYSPHSSYVENLYTNTLESQRTISYHKNFKVFTHSYSNERIKAQSGGFIFFSGDTFNPINPIYYEKIKIDKCDKNQVLKELEMIFHINESKLFPEKNIIAEKIKCEFIQDVQCDNELELEKEIESSFERIDYELKLMNYNNVQKLRYLRKEKEDLLCFVFSHQIEDKENQKGYQKTNYDRIITNINDFFDFVTRMI